MRRIALAMAALLIASVDLTPAWSQVALDESLEKSPSWRIPTAPEVREKMLHWLDEMQLDPLTRQKVEALWPIEPQAGLGLLSQAELLELVVESFAAVDSEVDELVEFTSKSHDFAPTPALDWLDDGQQTLPFARNNLKLWLGKWLVQERRFDEASLYLGGLQPSEVVDPAALLFYKGVCQHWGLQPSAGLTTIDLLLEQKKVIPRRYVQLAELMHADLTKLKEESLDHISRRMNDVTRRLDFGHAGKKVRGVEDGIIASLDKLIKDLEDQAGQGGEGGEGGEGMDDGGSGNPNGIRSSSPAKDSGIADGKGAGNVTSKRIGKRSGWGDLPPKEREAAIQQISKEFPSHYRDIIEQYFRKLATEEEQQK
ncbi:MAG: hypothetical protein IT427_04930 [Pirellulales bacterium]|nr:hypothetical protein [Pirellulales bacterium]